MASVSKFRFLTEKYYFCVIIIIFCFANFQSSASEENLNGDAGEKLSTPDLRLATKNSAIGSGIGVTSGSPTTKFSSKRNKQKKKEKMTTMTANADRSTILPLLTNITAKVSTVYKEGGHNEETVKNKNQGDRTQVHQETTKPQLFQNLDSTTTPLVAVRSTIVGKKRINKGGKRNRTRTTTTARVTALQNPAEVDQDVLPQETPSSKEMQETEGAQQESEQIFEPDERLKEAKMPRQPKAGDDETSSVSFLTYFLVATVVLVMVYVSCHNRQKILAYLVEGRRKSSTGSRRRQSSGSSASGASEYRQLSTNADEKPLLQSEARAANA
jgi:hypothetical protein